jgi:single-stranded-DNA-specific exonuclease
MNAVYFGDADEFISYLQNRFGIEETQKLLQGRENRIRPSLAYKPSLNEFRGQTSVQLQIAHFQ